MKPGADSIHLWPNVFNWYIIMKQSLRSSPAARNFFWVGKQQRKEGFDITPLSLASPVCGWVIKALWQAEVVGEPPYEACSPHYFSCPPTGSRSGGWASTWGGSTPTTSPAYLKRPPMSSREAVIGGLWRGRGLASHEGAQAIHR